MSHELNVLCTTILKPCTVSSMVTVVHHVRMGLQVISSKSQTLCIRIQYCTVDTISKACKISLHTSLLHSMFYVNYLEWLHCAFLDEPALFLLCWLQAMRLHMDQRACHLTGPHCLITNRLQPIQYALCWLHSVLHWRRSSTRHQRSLRCYSCVHVLTRILHTIATSNIVHTYTTHILPALEWPM